MGVPPPTTLWSTCKYNILIQTLVLHFYSQHKLKIGMSLLWSVIKALGRAIKCPELTVSSSGEEILPGTISKLCNGAQKACPEYGGPQFWQRVSCEISSALQELTAVKESLETAFDDLEGNRDQGGELQLLCGLSRGCVHTGAVITRLLQPTAIDPVSLRGIQYKCHQILVSSSLCINNTIVYCTR